MSDFELPAPIAAYFSAKDKSALEDTLACFAEDATVWDNGEDRELKGTAQIREWLSGTVASYELTSELIAAEQREDEFVVEVVVAGKFPGSPYKFENRFKLQEDKIAVLTIEPIGSLAG